MAAPSRTVGRARRFDGRLEGFGTRKNAVCRLLSCPCFQFSPLLFFCLPQVAPCQAGRGCPSYLRLPVPSGAGNRRRGGALGRRAPRLFSFCRTAVQLFDCCPPCRHAKSCGECVCDERVTRVRAWKEEGLWVGPRRPRGSLLGVPFAPTASRDATDRFASPPTHPPHTSDDADDDWPTTADGYVLHDQIGKGATATVSARVCGGGGAQPHGLSTAPVVRSGRPVCS